MSEAVAATDTSRSGNSVNERRHVDDGTQANDMQLCSADCQSVLAPARASELDPRSASRLGSRSFQPRFGPDARRFCLLLDPTPAPERRHACREFALTHACIGPVTMHTRRHALLRVPTRSHDCRTFGPNLIRASSKRFSSSRVHCLRGRRGIFSGRPTFSVDR